MCIFVYHCNIDKKLRWLASFELKVIYLGNTFCHHKWPLIISYKSVFLWGEIKTIKPLLNNTIYIRNAKEKRQNSVLYNKK